MTDQPAHHPVTILPPVTLTSSRSWKVGLWVAIAMVLLAILGVGLTTSDRAIAQKYWLCLVPVYALLCIGTAWTRDRSEARHKLVIRQVLHWLIVAGAITMDFTVRRSGEETGTAAGFTALLLLAVGCFMAGIYLEWLFSLVGLLLTATLVIAVRAEQHLWLIVIAGGLCIAGMIFVRRWLHHREHAKIAAKAS